MPIRIRRMQPISYYQANYHLPVISEGAATAYSELHKLRAMRSYDVANPPFFTQIEIETYNRCNNDCPFCPANRHTDSRIPLYMDDEVFSRIVAELKSINYRGTVTLSHNNEPLLDRRLPRFIREVRDSLPEARVSIWTNGILLDMATLELLCFSGLDDMVIDDYTNDGRHTPNIAKLIRDIRGSPIENRMNLTVWRRKKDSILSNRGGRSPNKSHDKLGAIERRLVERRWCPLPFKQFNINSSGLVHLCCNDVYSENVVGDIRRESIMEIWRSRKMRFIREELIARGRRNISPCRICDVTL